MKKVVLLILSLLSVAAYAKMRVDAEVAIKGIEKQETFFLEKSEDAVYVDESGTTLAVSVEPDGAEVKIDVKVYRKKLGVDIMVGHPIVKTAWGQEVVVECPLKHGILKLTVYKE
jgi:hypothetical protein